MSRFKLRLTPYKTIYWPVAIMYQDLMLASCPMRSIVAVKLQESMRTYLSIQITRRRSQWVLFAVWDTYGRTLVLWKVDCFSSAFFMKSVSEDYECWYLHVAPSKGSRSCQHDLQDTARHRKAVQTMIRSKYRRRGDNVVLVWGSRQQWKTRPFRPSAKQRVTHDSYLHFFERFDDVTREDTLIDLPSSLVTGCCDIRCKPNWTCRC